MHPGVTSEEATTGRTITGTRIVTTPTTTTDVRRHKRPDATIDVVRQDHRTTTLIRLEGQIDGVGGRRKARDGDETETDSWRETTSGPRNWTVLAPHNSFQGRAIEIKNPDGGNIHIRHRKTSPSPGGVTVAGIPGIPEKTAPRNGFELVTKDRITEPSSQNARHFQRQELTPKPACDIDIAESRREERRDIFENTQVDSDIILKDFNKKNIKTQRSSMEDFWIMLSDTQVHLHIVTEDSKPTPAPITTSNNRFRGYRHVLRWTWTSVSKALLPFNKHHKHQLLPWLWRECSNRLQ